MAGFDVAKNPSGTAQLLMQPLYCDRQLCRVSINRALGDGNVEGGDRDALHRLRRHLAEAALARGRFPTN